MRVPQGVSFLMVITSAWLLLAGPGETAVMIVLVVLGLALLLAFRRAICAAFRLLGPGSRFPRIREGWHTFLRPPVAQRFAHDRAAGPTARCATTTQKAGRP